MENVNTTTIPECQGGPFGIVVDGQLMRTDFEYTSGPLKPQWWIDVTDLEPPCLVAIFLTGQQAFPVDMGGSIYYSWPDATCAAHEFKSAYLGTINNSQPSCFFMITSQFKDQVTCRRYTAPIERPWISIWMNTMDEIGLQDPAHDINPYVRHGGHASNTTCDPTARSWKRFVDEQMQYLQSRFFKDLGDGPAN